MTEALRRILHPPGRPDIRWLFAFVMIFAGGALGFALPNWGAHLTLPLLPSGIAVAAMYRWGPRMWPAIFAAGAATDLWTRQPLIAAIGVGAGLAGGAALTAWVLRRRGFDPSFGRAKDTPLFILAAALGMTAAPTLGILGFRLAHDAQAGAIDPVHWVRWWGNTTTGVLVVAPMMVAVTRRSVAQFTERWREGALLLLGVAACGGLLLLPIDGQLTRPPGLILALIFVMVGTVRFGLVTGAFASCCFMILVVFGVTFDRGAFSHLSDLQGLVMIWSVSAALTCATLIITALLAERDSEGLQKLRAEQRYAQIFDGSPQPIWVHDRDTLRILMINEAALRQYGWDRHEMTSMSVAQLIPPGGSHVPQETEVEQSLKPRTEPFESRHLTRDGRVLDVDVWTRPIELLGQPAELVFAVDVTERRAFGRALIDAVAGEQRRIGQEMHDGLGQELTGLALSARALANRAHRERDAVADDLDQLALLATSCIKDARLIVQGLSPLTDADGSLEAALDALARQSSLSGTPVQFHVCNEAPLIVDLKVRNHLYRIAQEAVQNALKHSGARTIDIDLLIRNRSVRLEILDDGRGPPIQDLGSAGLGTRTMRFRSSAIGASLSLRRRSPRGYSVLCEAPQTRAWSAPESARG